MKFLPFLLLVLSLTGQAQMAGTYKIGAGEPAPFHSIKSAVEELNKQGLAGDVTLALVDAFYAESEIAFLAIKNREHYQITLAPSAGISSTIESDGKTIIQFNSGINLQIGSDAPNDTLTLRQTKSSDFIIRDLSTGLHKKGSIKLTRLNVACFGNNAINKRQNEIQFSEVIDIHLEHCTFIGVNLYFVSFSGLYDYVQAVIQNCAFGSSEKPAGHFLFLGVKGGKFKNNIIRNVVSLEKLFTVVYSDSFDISSNRFSDIVVEELVTTNDLFWFSGVVELKVYNNEFKNIFCDTHLINQGYESVVPLNYFSFNRCKNVQFHYNTIHTPRSEKYGFSGNDKTIGIAGVRLFKCSNSTATFTNNIISFEQGMKSGHEGSSIVTVFDLDNVADLNGLHADYNVYNVANHTENNLATIGGKPYTLDTWKQKKLTADRHSVWQRPNFISDNDLHLQKPNAIATPLAWVTHDLDEIIRNTTTPDAGAYEYIEHSKLKVSSNCFGEVSYFQFESTEVVTSYNWQFGDTNTSTQAHPTHTYATPGEYTVTLQATYPDAHQETVTKEITIYPTPKKPVIIQE